MGGLLQKIPYARFYVGATLCSRVLNVDAAVSRILHTGGLRLEN